MSTPSTDHHDDRGTGHGREKPRRTERSHRTGGSRRRRVGVAAWVLTLTLPAAAAFALWTVGGAGQGAAKATTATQLTVSPGAASAQLYPGASGDVVYSVTNPNPFPVSVTGVTLGAVTGVAGCTAASFSTAAGTVAATAVPAGETRTVTVTGGITMLASAGDGCQGVSVQVAGTLVAAQA